MDRQMMDLGSGLGVLTLRELRVKTQPPPVWRTEDDMLAITEQLDEVQEKWAAASIEAVIQHLIREHRSWRIKDFPMIEYLFDCLDGTHGPPPPACLVSLRRAFYRLRAETEARVNREENILFPAIMRNPATMLEDDHDEEGRLLRAMRDAADNYLLPDNAHENLRLLFRELQALEAAMHAHTHLESSILFARALQA